MDKEPIFCKKLQGLYEAYLGDESWERYSKKIIEGEAKRAPGFFDDMECPEGVPEDIAKICFAWWGDMGWVDDTFGYLFDNYSVIEILKHCKHGEIIVRAGLQRLHW